MTKTLTEKKDKTGYSRNPLNDIMEYDDDDEEYFYDEIFSGYSENMPCDSTGICGGTSCPNFFKCNG